MLGGSKEVIFQSKVNPYAQCGKMAMENLVLCTKCGKWMHGRCAKIKRML